MEIARLTGFSRTSVAFIVNRLLGKRLVTEERVGASTGAGRPAGALQITDRSFMAIGVEIATPVSGVVLVDSGGKRVARRDVAWQADVGLFFDGIANAVQDLAGGYKKHQILGVGVSLPGTINKATGLVLGAEALGWFNVDAGKLLSQRLKWPLFFENDANLSALAEQWFLPAGHEVFSYFVYVRTQGGVGTGVVADGRILHGVSSAGLEFGHVILYPDGRPCRCGNTGCWEQYASDAALVRNWEELGGGTGSADIGSACVELVDRARHGDGVALEALNTTAKYLALGFVNLAAALNPQAIVMGEPFSSAWDLIRPAVIQQVRRRLPTYTFEQLRILPGRLGADSALRGAAALVLAHFFTRFDHTRDDSLPNRVSMVAHGR